MNEEYVVKVRADFFDRLADLKDHQCPVCDAKCKMYKRKLNAGMVRSLLAIRRKLREGNGEDGWLHVSKAFLEDKENAVAGEYSKLRFWNLLEEKSSNSGWWRLTEFGEQFVQGNVSVPKHAYIYHNELWGVGEELTDIIEAAEDKFDYHELMGRERPECRN